jgi:hypothetical protein
MRASGAFALGPASLASPVSSRAGAATRRRALVAVENAHEQRITDRPPASAFKAR